MDWDKVRIFHAVADAGDRNQDGHRPVGLDEADGAHRQAGEGQTGDQQQPGADPVDQEAGHDLESAGSRGEKRQEKPQGGVADVEFLLNQRKQRRQGQLVEVAEPMAGADQRLDEGVGAAGGGVGRDVSSHGRCMSIVQLLPSY